MAASNAYISCLSTIAGFAKYLASSNPNLGDTLGRLNETFGTSYTYGTGDNQLNQYFMATVTASSTQSYAFVSPTNNQTDVAGDALILSAVKEIVIYNASTTAGHLTCGGSIINSGGGVSTGSIRVQPQGVFHWSYPGSGIALVSLSVDTITVNPNSISRTWTIFVAGVA